MSISLSSKSVAVEDFVAALKAQKISKGTVLEINGSEYIFKSVNGSYVYCENDSTFTLPKASMNGNSVPSNLIKTVKVFNVIVTNTMPPQFDEEKV